MRIGIDARMLGSAPGIGRYIEQLTRELFRLDAKNEYVLFLREPAYSSYVVHESPRQPVSSPRESAVSPRASARIRKVHAPERWYSFAEQVTWPWRIRRERLDLLFVPQFNVPLLAPCPFVVTIHDVTQLYMPGPLQARSRLRQRAFRLVFAKALRRARAVIAVSRYTKEETVRNFRIDPAKIRVIYEGPGLSPEATETLNKPKAQNSKNRNGLGFRVSGFEFPNSQYILAVGVWRPHKNFVGLLDAFAVLKRRPEFGALRLVLAGEEDPRYPEVRERIAALGLSDVVATPGMPGDDVLLALYRHARAVIVPSLYEGFGFVGLEALAFGVPVAAARAAALPEILGDAAAYFNPRDTEEMARVIARVLTDDGERGRVLSTAPPVLARYSWRRAAEETLSVLRVAAQNGNTKIQPARQRPDAHHARQRKTQSLRAGRRLAGGNPKFK